MYINGDLYIFGGKARLYPATANLVYNDIWKLTIPHLKWYSFPYLLTTQIIPSSSRIYLKINGNDLTTTNNDLANDGLCIEKIIVEVEIFHECLSQLRLSLMGPGPQTGSPNFHQLSTAYEILLLDQPKSNNTGCFKGIHKFTFKDDLSTVFTTFPSGRDINECCNNTYTGTYKPDGKLSEFVGASMSAEWTLIVEDMLPDHLSGYVTSWNINFLSNVCVKKYKWTNITKPYISTLINTPSPRYHSLSVVYNHSFFIYGGRDIDDNILYDLHRYDIDTNTWSILHPINFNFVFESTASYGYNLALTSWGLIKYGGYARQPYITSSSYNYMDSENIYILDPITLKWKLILLSTIPQTSTKNSLIEQTKTFIGGKPFTNNKPIPPMRYLSSIVFIPSNSMHWLQSYPKLSYREFYDEHTNSEHANYVNKIIDSLFIFGGSNGATGSILDGSSGGMLNDMWALRLSNYSTPGNRYYQNLKLYNHCYWRNTTTGINIGNTFECMGINSTTCDLRNLLMMSWCTSLNQTFV